MLNKTPMIGIALLIALPCFAQTKKQAAKVASTKEIKSTTHIPRVDQPDTKDLLDTRAPKGQPPGKSHTRVTRLDEPDPNDLLDITFTTPTPASPNAGRQVSQQIPLTGTYTFNKKVGFMVNSPEGDMVSYFFLNTQNGSAMLDHNGIKAMQGGEAEGEMTQIKNANNDFIQYIRSSEGNFVMKMGSGQSMVVHDLQTGALSTEFFKTFKKTGNVVKKSGSAGIPFNRVEYEGKYEGTTMSIWLSDAGDTRLDTKFTSSITGYWGLGYIAAPSGKTYMVTGIQGNGVNIFMTYMQNHASRFSGAGYKPVGDFAKTAGVNSQANGAANKKAIYDEVNKETDPQLRAMKLQQAKIAEEMLKQNSTERFAATSDLKDLPLANAAGAEAITLNFFKIQMSSLEQAIYELNVAAREMQDQEGGADPRLLRSNRCQVACNQNELNRIKALSVDYEAVCKQYKNKPDLRDEKIDAMMQRHAATIEPCNCQ